MTVADVAAADEHAVHAFLEGMQDVMGGNRSGTLGVVVTQTTTRFTSSGRTTFAISMALVVAQQTMPVA
jgi:hypothetical protein